MSKEINKTYLSIDKAEERGIIHRDYLAHALRWTHVVKSLHEKSRYKTARILDIGCGKEAPLAKTLYTNKMSPMTYDGVDAGSINPPQFIFKQDKFPFLMHPNIDIIDFKTERTFNVITCFECLEHVKFAHAFQIIWRISDLLEPEGIAFISTPAWNMSDTAGNHLNEMKYEVMGSLLELAGLNITAAYGTFASISDYIEALTKDGWLPLFTRLREYYDTNVLSIIFAPLYPALARNVLWEVRQNRKGDLKSFPMLHKIKEPWASDTSYKEFVL